MVSRCSGGRRSAAHASRGHKDGLLWHWRSEWNTAVRGGSHRWRRLECERGLWLVIGLLLLWSWSVRSLSLKGSRSCGGGLKSIDPIERSHTAHNKEGSGQGIEVGTGISGSWDLRKVGGVRTVAIRYKYYHLDC